ncbi:MAG: glycoside hydrolase family 18 protein [Acidobacteriia bacterium]|nr:glycoside hydrolase family 18 protein [Terriglobia bacterium]
MSLNDIPWSKVTHVIHFAINPSDPAGGITTVDPASADAFTAAAHQAGVKALLCVRDNNSIISLFSTVLRNNLNGFANNVASFVQAHNYDGVDLNWEAGNYNGLIDQNNYINLIMELRNLLGPTKIMTISVYWQYGLASVVQRTVSNLDQVNVMCYDMDQYNSDLYFNTATYSASGDTTHNSCATQAGNFSGYVPASKIGLGIPFYARMWTGCADIFCNDGLHDPLQVWFANPTQKTMHYNKLVASSYWSAPHSWDAARGASYISIDQNGSLNDRFISYTDAQQIGSIVQLMNNRGYGGVMEYELQYDFFASQQGDARHPLAAAVYSAVFGSQ